MEDARRKIAKTLTGSRRSVETKKKVSGEGNKNHKLALKEVIQIKQLFKLRFSNSYTQVHFF